MYEELVKRLRNCATQATACEICDMVDDCACIDTLMNQAADAIEEMSKLANAIPHVCECCVGCELEKKNGGCDRAFVLSPKRAMQYLRKPRWIPVTERLPNGEALALNALKGSYGYHEYLLGYVGADSESDTGFRCENEGEILMNVTHWMPLPEPPKEET